MKTLELTVNIENETVTTTGATHQMKGNIDGTINFYEAGIDGMNDKDEIEEALIELNEEKYDEVVVEFETMKNYKVYINKLSTQSGMGDYDFQAENDEKAIEELRSNMTPQDNGKDGDYELEMFEVIDEEADDFRFVDSINLKKWI